MQFQNIEEKILIVDFGSQVTRLIARRVRDLGVYSEIITPKQINRYTWLFVYYILDDMISTQFLGCCS